MTNIEINALENAGRTTAVWGNEDSSVSNSAIWLALIPASLILVAITALMLVIF